MDTIRYNIVNNLRISISKILYRLTLLYTMDYAQLTGNHSALLFFCWKTEFRSLYIQSWILPEVLPFRTVSDRSGLELLHRKCKWFFFCVGGFQQNETTNWQACYISFIILYFVLFFFLHISFFLSLVDFVFIAAATSYNTQRNKQVKSIYLLGSTNLVSRTDTHTHIIFNLYGIKLKIHWNWQSHVWKWSTL